MGFSKSVNWKTGVGGKGNDGVTGYIKQVKNSIGYVEFSYAKQNKITYTKLVNKVGNIVSPTIATFSETAKNANGKAPTVSGFGL